MDDKSEKRRKFREALFMTASVLTGIIATIGLLVCLSCFGDTLWHGILIGLAFITTVCILAVPAYLKSEDLGFALVMTAGLMAVLLLTWGAAYIT